MSSERDESFANIDPSLYSSDSLQVHPSSSFQSSTDHMTSSVYGSSLSPLSSGFRSTSSLSAVDDYLAPDQTRILTHRVEKLEETVDAIRSELKSQGELIRELSKRPFISDEKDNDLQGRKRQKALEEKLEIAPLTALTPLTPAQSQTRKELMEDLLEEMPILAGLAKGVRFLPCDSEPGEEGSKLVPDLSKDVVATVNKRFIDTAARLVFKRNKDEKLRKVTDATVAFTIKDVERLSKEAFRKWKRDHDKKKPEKKEKHDEMNKRAARRQRQRQKKHDRVKAAKVLHRATGLDVTKCCMTDWMSEAISDRPAGEHQNEQQKRDYIALKRLQAGLTEAAAPETIWETIKPAFRSEEGNELYLKLDEILAELQKRSKQKKQSIKRVFLGRKKYDIPAVAPFEFMVDQFWKAANVDAKGLADSFKTLDDPEGLGSKTNPALVISKLDAARIVVTAMSIENRTAMDSDEEGDVDGE